MIQNAKLNLKFMLLIFCFDNRMLTTFLFGLLVTKFVTMNDNYLASFGKHKRNYDFWRNEKQKPHVMKRDSRYVKVVTELSLI